MNTLKYNDMIKKYYYYKNNIIKNYINQGIYPDNKMIELTMNRIDLALPILQGYTLAEGSDFDTEKYNDTFKQLHQDLQFLYELTYELTVERFQNMKLYLDSHLQELQNKADNCYKRALIEKNSTALGNTVFYKANVIPEINNNVCIMNFEDELELCSGSKIACFLSAGEIAPDNIVFMLTDTSTNEIHYAPVYNDNQYSFNVPGDLIYDSYDISFADNETTNKQTKLLLDGSDYNTNNMYKVYSGIGKMIVRRYDSNKCDILDIPVNSAVHIDKHSYVEFYVLDGGDITFTYNKRPINANFQTEYNTVDTRKQNHIFFECDNDFAFSITMTSGNVYAYNNASVYNNTDHLIADNPHLLKNFTVKEYKRENNVTKYKLSVRINNIDNPQLIVDNITIKELLPL